MTLIKSAYSVGIALLIILWSHGAIKAQAGSILWVPDSVKISAQETTSLELRIDHHVTGVHCFLVSVHFDSSLLEIVSIDEGPLLRSAGSTFFFWDSLDHPTDIGNCILGYGLYADGPGMLAEVRFRAKLKGGTTLLEFTQISFSDINLNAITVGHLNGKVVVESINIAPLITTFPVTTATVGQTYLYDVEATGYPVPTFVLEAGAPPGMAIDGVSGLIEWTPEAVGDFPITVQATNVAGTAEQNFTIHVGCCTGTTGNVNMSGIIDGGDLALLVAYLTNPPGSKPTLPCLDEANANAAGIVDGGDLALLVAYLTNPPGMKPALPNCP